MDGVARAALLETWTERDWNDGLSIDAVGPLERITVVTHNNAYEIVVLEPATAQVLVRGGAFFPTPSRALLSGATLGGAYLKLRSIHVGFSMEFNVGGGSVVTTSPVRSIDVSRGPAAVM